MSKQIELEKLDRTIKDGQIRLCTLHNNIDLLNKDIATLRKLESQLEENVACLKKSKVVAIAVQFKKAKEELTKTKRLLIVAQNDREELKRSANNINKMIDDSRQAIETINKNGENNVVHGKFGKKDDR